MESNIYYHSECDFQLKDDESITIWLKYAISKENKELGEINYNFGIGDDKKIPIKFIGKFDGKPKGPCSVIGYAKRHKNALVLFSANGKNDGIFYKNLNDVYEKIN